MSTLAKENTAISFKNERHSENVIFSFETISDIETALEEIFSTSAASVILSAAGKKSGANVCRKMMQDIKDLDKVLDHFSNLKRMENWGKIFFQGVDFVGASGRVIVIESFETVARKTSQPCCHLFRGFLEGFLSELLGKTLTVTEEKCSGKGDEHCEFAFKTS